MKILRMEQGSPEWLASRIGLPTSSNFDRIVTKTGKPSAAADRYLAKLVAEWFMGTSLDDADSGFMERGRQLEPEAIAAYEFAHDLDTERVGLCLTDDGGAGCSPDRLVGPDGLLECKCPSAEIHMMYLLDGPPSDYFCQVQGQLLVTGRKWCDLYCWHPYMPSVTRRYGRDDEFLELLGAELGKFTARIASAKATLKDVKADYDAKLREDVPAEFSTP